MELEGVKPQKERITIFLEKTKFPNSKVQEGLAVISWFPQSLQDLYTKIIRNISNILPTP